MNGEIPVLIVIGLLYFFGAISESTATIFLILVIALGFFRAQNNETEKLKEKINELNDRVEELDSEEEDFD